MVGSPLYSIAFRKLIKISGCSEAQNILLNAKSALGLMKRILEKEEGRRKKEEGKCNILGIFRLVVALYHPERNYEVFQLSACGLSSSRRHN
ncbi:hypothetical protein QUA20_12240 [Microcoleus sp. Pol7_A1]|uniref:hypothetical protein n=1 Tax=Microcoleus sp. Pol7_A1 TaxID=2818893 RepID=UPI002FD2E830